MILLHSVYYENQPRPKWIRSIIGPIIGSCDRTFSVKIYYYCKVQTLFLMIFVLTLVICMLGVPPNDRKSSIWKWQKCQHMKMTNSICKDMKMTNTKNSYLQAYENDQSYLQAYENDQFSRFFLICKHMKMTNHICMHRKMTNTINDLCLQL